MVLFGGLQNADYLNETWVLTGNEWQQKHPTISPPPRTGASMAYDSTLGGVVLFGGIAKESENSGRTISLNDMWLWNGTDWKQISPRQMPPVRFGAEMVDTNQQGLLLFGGGAGGGFYDDTWLWDGEDWSELQPAHRPPARADFAMTFHTSLQKVILFGGQNFGGFATDTWLWDGEDWSQLETRESPPEGMSYGAQMIQFGEKMGTLLYNSVREKNDAESTSNSELWILDRWP